MIYLSQLLGNPVIDSDGERIGVVNDLGIATGEVFPRVTSLAFQGPGKTPFMISWRKYVDSFGDGEVHLKVPSTDIRFSYLQPEEVLIARDLLNKQIVDTRGMKVVRVNDLKLSDTSSSQLRLLGAEVGVRGILRSLSPTIETLAQRVAHTFGRDIPERVIAWNYMDLLDRDLSNVKLSVTHKTLDELHPADIADIIEQLDPRLRGQVFAQLDDEQAAEAMAELDDDQAAEIMGDMTELDASKMLAEMDPDDAAELVSELDYEKAEKLLRLMGVKEERAIRQLLGYKDDTAGRIMTSEFVSLSEDATISDAIERLRNLDEDFESVHYVYLCDEERHLKGVLSLLAIVTARPDDRLGDLVEVADLITASPDDDQEDVAEDISKYNLMAMPVVDEKGRMLGIVTVDDALDVLEEEHEEDLQIAGGSHTSKSDEASDHLLGRVFSNEMWFFFWVAGMLALALLAPALGRPAMWGLVAAVGLPVALRAADTMVRYATNFFLEYDEDDEDAPSVLGFGFKGVAVSVAYSAVMLLVALAASNIFAVPAITAGSHALYDVLAAGTAGLKVAAATVVIGFASAPAYLLTLRRRDDAGLDTSGLSLRVTSLAIACVLFVALACAAAAVGVA